MNKKLNIFLVVLLAASCLTACGAPSVQASDGSLPVSDKGQISIVTTIFPEYDWARVILGENPANADLCFLLDSGVDLHSYQPTAADILKISECDLFIYVGGESDEWVEDALAEATNKDMIVVNLLDTLGSAVKEEELVEGMQEEEHDHEHDEDADDEHDHEHEHEEGEVEYDEHVWLSLKNASVLCAAIEAALEELDPSNATVYQDNCNSYLAELGELDREYAQAVADGSRDTVLFGDRFPFRYLTDDYDLNYYAAFVGCSAESEASFETITFLAGKMDELSLNTVLTIESSDGRIAQTIVDNTASKDARILTLDSLQSATAEDVANGQTYLGTMEDNLEVLKEALR